MVTVVTLVDDNVMIMVLIVTAMVNDGQRDCDDDCDGDQVNYKARLEHKRYLAQESPEPVIDLSLNHLFSCPGQLNN